MKVEFSGLRPVAGRQASERVGNLGGVDRVTSCAGIGALWGAVCGLLFAPAVVVLPLLAWVGMDGVFAEALAGSIVGAAVLGGLSGLGAALIQLFVGKDEAIKH